MSKYKKKKINAEVPPERDFDATVRRSSRKATINAPAEVPLQEDHQRDDKWRRYLNAMLNTG